MPFYLSKRFIFHSSNTNYTTLTPFISPFLRQDLSKYLNAFVWSQSLNNLVNGTIWRGTNQNFGTLTFLKHRRNSVNCVSFTRPRRSLYQKKIFLSHFSYLSQCHMLRLIKIVGLVFNKPEHFRFYSFR